MDALDFIIWYNNKFVSGFYIQNDYTEDELFVDQ